MNARDDVAYRLALANGFLVEAEQDYELERWRSCVDNAQLAIENAGKAVLIQFGASSKTHDPAKLIFTIRQEQEMSAKLAQKLVQLEKEMLAYGASTHFLTDYGDEETHTLPWELFDEPEANNAISTARKSLNLAQQIVAIVAKEQSSNNSS